MNIIKSEIIKTFSVRSSWIYLTLITAGMASASVLTTTFSAKSTFTLNEVSGGADLVLLILIFAVASIIGADKSQKTLAWTYLATNRRVTHLLIQLGIVVGACVLAGIMGQALGVLGVFAFGDTMDWANSMTFAGSNWALSSLVRWVYYGMLAALLTRLLGSGIYAAMILLAEIFVIGTVGGVGDGLLASIASLMPLPNTQILVHGGELLTSIDHGRGIAALALALALCVAGAGAVWAAKRRAIS